MFTTKNTRTHQLSMNGINSKSTNNDSNANINVYKGYTEREPKIIISTISLTN